MEVVMRKKNKTDHSYVIAKNIAKTLILHRVWKGYTQQNIGDAVGLTFQQIQKYEKMINRISAETLIDICKQRDWDITLFTTNNPAAILSEWILEVNLDDPESVYHLRLDQIKKSWAKLDRVGKTNYYFVNNPMAKKLVQISNDLEDQGIDPRDTILPIVKGE
jgi:transcriptional regulator with XRE-family HTH domain|tara:strand:+ start:582 stop:1070 length:489 start_codon:yes stop_codon:yes gene_type:complete